MNTRTAVTALVAAMLSAIAPVAQASFTFHPSNDESGTENHVSPGTLSRTQKAEGERAEGARRDQNWEYTSEAAGWELRPHSYELRGGRMVHTDSFPHDTAKPTMKLDTPLDRDLPSGG